MDKKKLEDKGCTEVDLEILQAFEALQHENLPAGQAIGHVSAALLADRSGIELDQVIESTSHLMEIGLIHSLKPFSGHSLYDVALVVAAINEP